MLESKLRVIFDGEPSVSILLAEPGAGKTNLLRDIADRSSVTLHRASTFRKTSGSKILVVDAFDEVAKVGESRVYDILERIRDSEPDHVLLSSRSSEWEGSITRFVRYLFEITPIVAHLVPLNNDGQRRLFKHLYPGKIFETFYEDIRRFDLHHLLGNPQFLDLFASAYSETKGHLPSREKIFDLAIDNLAKENNSDVPEKRAPSKSKRISWANETFAKLLLAGSDGVATGDIAESMDDLHPQFEAIGMNDDRIRSILDTKLFRPGAVTNQHEPVHRIVAEYCAAKYLVKYIDNPSCRFTLTQFRALIAPNNIMRDDLRGLLGWIAALGSQKIQDTAIALDAYAVLSNGDPSMLSSVSRVKLLDALVVLNIDNPHFRRGDRHRSFQTSGFFTHNTLDIVRQILEGTENGHLKELILEMLVGSSAVMELRIEIETILFDNDSRIRLRTNALDCLLNDETYITIDALQKLVTVGDRNALGLAIEVLRQVDTKEFYGQFLSILKKAGDVLYPADINWSENHFHEKYELKRLIQDIDLETCICLLTDLTTDLSCTCGNSPICLCRDGTSKIASMLLNQFFHQNTDPYDPDQIWSWIKNLHFHGSIGANQNRAVKILQENDALRRSLQKKVFMAVTDPEMVSDICCDVIENHTHSGLHLCRGDARHLADFAFQENNAMLWNRFAYPHNYYEKETSELRNLRRHCRAHALKKPNFMELWAKMNRDKKMSWKKDQRLNQKLKQIERQQHNKEKQISADNFVYVKENIDLIERGGNIKFISEIAHLYLMYPDQISKVTYGLINPEKTLRKSLETLRDQCPTIIDLGKGISYPYDLVRIFFAGALAEFRQTGALKEVDLKILYAILPDFRKCDTLTNDERHAFYNEIRKCIMFTKEKSENYVREYIEPSLDESNSCFDLDILDREPAFNHLRATLPVEWLTRFSELPIEMLDPIFEIAADFGDRDALLKVIRNRCTSFDESMLSRKRKKQRSFWFLRDFWFADEIDPDVRILMKSNPDIIHEHESRLFWHNHNDSWPHMSARKIELIILECVPYWSKTVDKNNMMAYPYLRDVVWQIAHDKPIYALPVIENLISKKIMSPVHNDLRSIRAEMRRRYGQPTSYPYPDKISNFFDAGNPTSVEQIRALVLEMFHELQEEILAGGNNLLSQYYDGGKRLNEIVGMSRVSAWMRPRLAPFNIHHIEEHTLSKQNRCDLTATHMLNGSPKMLVIEGKGQWHSDLFTAAKSQLAERYAMHPDADNQGIYLVLWYGSDEKVAGKKRHSYQSAKQLQKAINDQLPDYLQCRLDIFVLDVSELPKTP